MKKLLLYLPFLFSSVFACERTEPVQSKKSTESIFQKTYLMKLPYELRQQLTQYWKWMQLDNWSPNTPCLSSAINFWGTQDMLFHRDIQVTQLEKSKDRLNFSFIRNSKYIIGSDFNPSCWETETGKKLWELDKSSILYNPFRSFLQSSADGKYIFLCSWPSPVDQLFIIDASNGAVFPPLKLNQVRIIQIFSLHQSNKIYAIIDETGIIKLKSWHYDERASCFIEQPDKTLNFFSTPEDDCFILGSKIVVRSPGNKLKFYDLFTLKDLNRDVKIGLKNGLYTSDKHSLFISAYLNANSAMVINLENKKFKKQQKMTFRPYYFLDPDQLLILDETNDEQLLYDLLSKQLLQRIIRKKDVFSPRIKELSKNYFSINNKIYSFIHPQVYQFLQSMPIEKALFLQAAYQSIIDKNGKKGFLESIGYFKKAPFSIDQYQGILNCNNPIEARLLATINYVLKNGVVSPVVDLNSLKKID